VDIVDFIKMHYCLTRRTDTNFWKDNTLEETIPDTLKVKLEAWKYRVPGVYEFQSIPKVFGLSNYLQVLYGMDYLPDLSEEGARYQNMAEARVQSSRYLAAFKGGQELLPIQRDLINDIYSKGFQKP
jgi:tryptophan halogenase